MKKRFLAGIMALTMVMTLVPSNVLAEEDATEQEAVVAETETTEVQTSEESGSTEEVLSTEEQMAESEETDEAEALEDDPEPFAEEEEETQSYLEGFKERINALPTVEEFQTMSSEEQLTVYETIQNLADEYESLTEEEQGQLDIGKLEALFEYSNSQVSVMAEYSYNSEQNYALYSEKNGLTVTFTMTKGLNKLYDWVIFLFDPDKFSNVGYDGNHKLTNSGNMSLSAADYAFSTGQGEDDYNQLNKVLSVTAANTAVDLNDSGKTLNEVWSEKDWVVVLGPHHNWGSYPYSDSKKDSYNCDYYVGSQKEIQENSMAKVGTKQVTVIDASADYEYNLWDTENKKYVSLTWQKPDGDGNVIFNSLESNHVYEIRKKKDDKIESVGNITTAIDPLNPDSSAGGTPTVNVEKTNIICENLNRTYQYCLVYEDGSTATDWENASDGNVSFERLKPGKKYYLIAKTDDNKKSDKYEYITGKITITYNANVEGEDISAPEPQEFADGDRLCDYSPERTGYSFYGWEDKAKPWNTYHPGYSYTNSFFDDVTLYAVWRRQTFRIEGVYEAREYIIRSNEATYGEDYTFKIEPREGYSLLEDGISVSVNGEELPADCIQYVDGLFICTIKNVKEQKTIQVTSINYIDVLSNKKQAAKEALENERDTVLSQINNLTNLTEEQKSDYTQTIETTISSAINQILDAQSEYYVENLQSNAKQDLARILNGAKELDFSNEKQNAINEINAKATEAVTAIDALTGLDEEKKNEVLDNVNNIKNEAIEKVNNVTLEDRESIENLKKEALENIETLENETEAPYLSELIKAAVNEINAKAKEAEESIEKLSDLTKEEIVEFKKAVEDNKTEAVNNINSAKKATEVNNYKELGLNGITAKATEAVEKDLSNTRNKAIAAIEKKAEEAGKEIDALTELTADEKQTAKTQINSVTQNAKTEIKKSEKSEIEGLQNSDINDVDKILEDAKKQDFSKVQAVAKAAIKKNADDAVKTIDAMSKLTEDEKKAAKDEITEAAVKAEAAIDNAAAKEQVTEEKTAGCNEIQTITDKYAKQNLSKLKEDAIAVIETNADQATAQIDALEDLTAEQKTAAKNEIDEKVTSAKAAIEEASTENKVESAKSTNVNEVNQLVEAALNNAKEVANAAIDEKISTAKTTIDVLEDLTTEQKATAKEEIDKSGAAAKTTIDKVKDASDNNKIKDAKERSYDEVDKIVKDALEKDFSNAKVAAKAAIDEEAKTAEEAIDAMPNLTNERKAAAKAQIATEAKAAKSAIDSVTDVTKKADVTADKNAGIEALEKIVKDAAQDDLANLKAAVKVQISGNAENAKKSIDALEDLTEAEKTEAKAAIEKSVEKATSAINNVTDASKKNEVETAKNTNFDEVKQIVEDASEKDLSNAKAKAKAAIDEEAKTADEAVGAMPNLTDKQKEAAKAKIADKVKDVNKAIESVTDAANKADVTAEKNAGIKALEEIVEDAAQDNLSNLKAASKVEVEQKAIDAKAKIDAMEDLTAEQKTEAKAAIDEKAEAAKAAIEKVTDKSETDKIKEAKETSYTEVEQIVKDALADDLSNAKVAAKAAIDEEAKTAEEAIDAMPNLTDEKKAEAKAQIATEAKAAKNAIDSVTDVTKKADVATEKNAGIEAMKKIVEEAAQGDLANLKAALKVEISENAETAKKSIDALEDLTEAEKTEAKAEIEKSVEKATSAIDNVTDASKKNEVETAKNTNFDEVKQIVEDASEKDLSNAKAKAKAAIDEAAKTADEAVDAMPKLTDEQKEAAKAKIADKVKAVNKAIESVTDAAKKAEVTADKNAGIEALEKIVEEAAQDNLSNLKAASKVEVEQKAIDAKAQIDALEDLTAEQKTEAKAAIDEKAEAAKAAIEKVTDKSETDKIKEAKETSYTEVEQIVKKAADNDLANLKAALKVEISENAETAKKAIDALEDLTEAEKAEAKAAIEKSVEKATSAIDNVTDASKKNEVEIAKNTNLDEVNQIVADASEKDLSNAKDTAKAELDKKADEANAAIDAMTDLTAEEKEAAKAQVDKKVEAAKKAIDEITNPAEKSKISSELEVGTAEISKKNDAAANQNESNAAANKEKAEEAEKKANTVISDIKVSATDKDTIKNEIKKELEKEGLTGVDVDINDFNKVPATLDEDGRITGTAVIESGSTKKTVTIDKELPKLSSFVSYECQTAEDAPKADVSVDEKALKKNVLTQAQINVLANGGTSDISLQIESKEKTVSAEEKNLVDNILAGTKKIGTFIDISLLLTVTDADGKAVTSNEKIHEPDTVFTIKVTVPENLRADGRTYQMARIHDGKAEILSSEYDANGNTLTFETDKFSTYAIIYTESNTDNGGNGDNSTTDNNNGGNGDNNTTDNNNGGNSDNNTTDNNNGGNSDNNTTDNSNAGNSNTSNADNSADVAQKNIDSNTVNSATDNSQTAAAPGTGDSNRVMNGLILLLIAMVALAGAFGKRRKESM